MANISDIIEQFIIEAMQEEKTIQLSRNELANFFSCAPSQINYVLATRFSNDRGYEVFSQRGGGGYIKLSRIIVDKNNIIPIILNNHLTEPINFNTAKNIISNLEENKYFTKEEANLILSAITPKALSAPMHIENNLRTQILRSILINKLNNMNNKEVNGNV